MFQPESKDPIFKILLKFFALIYMVCATMFLIQVKPVIEFSAIFLCASLWIFAVMFYLIWTKSGSFLDGSISVDNATANGWSIDSIFFKIFTVVGGLIVYIASQVEVFFLITVTGFIFYMATMYLWVYLLTKVIRYFYPQNAL